MTVLEARIRRRLFGTRYVHVFRNGEEVFGGDDNVVKIQIRRTHAGVRLWSLWSERRDDVETDLEVMEWYLPNIDELRVERA